MIWFGLMIFLSHQNGDATYVTGMGLTKAVLDLAAWLGIALEAEALHMLLRRAAHVGLFLVFALLVMLTASSLRAQHAVRIPVWAPALFCVLFAWADEATKILVNGRHFSWIDVGLNLIGCAVGCAAGWFIAGRGFSAVM